MMTEEETEAAVDALIDWFESQDIMMFDAIDVVGRLLVYIHAAAKAQAEEVD